jgi:serine phosphatase RsbU (regulator of sigma subunit)
LTLASAGHMPVIIRRANGSVEEVGESIAGFPLGIMPESDYQQIEADLHPGDVAVVYSDGVTDARNMQEELYGNRLHKRIAESSGTPSSIGRAVLQEIREFSAGHSQADDMTLICFGPLA